MKQLLILLCLSLSTVALAKPLKLKKKKEDILDFYFTKNGEPVAIKEASPEEVKKVEEPSKEVAKTQEAEKETTEEKESTVEKKEPDFSLKAFAQNIKRRSSFNQSISANKEEELFYHMTIATDRYSLANRFLLSYEGFELPIVPFLGADFFHQQNRRDFSGIGAGVGVIYSLFKYSTVSADASFRQTLEYWSVPT